MPVVARQAERRKNPVGRSSPVSRHAHSTIENGIRDTSRNRVRWRLFRSPQTTRKAIVAVVTAQDTS
jgi:hypothetical protein